MTDIVEQIRELAGDGYAPDGLLSDWLYEAADEIERLRAEVTEKNHLIGRLHQRLEAAKFAASAETASADVQKQRADDLQALIDGIASVLDPEGELMAHTTYRALDRDECREIAALLAAATPKEDDR